VKEEDAMRWLAQLRMRMQMLFLRGKATARLEDELRFHLERQIAENLAAGMNSEEARYAALRKFGNPALLREQARATWSWTWLELLARDLRYGVRTLWRTPGFAIVAILVMALGIGANVALFTVVRSVLLKPLPFVEPDRLVALYEHSADDQYPYNVIAPGVFAEWRRQNRSFSDLALFGDAEFSLSGASGQLPEKVRGASCTWNLLSTLGVQPALGRDFTAADDRHSANATVLMSWGLWKRRFAGNPAILNQSIHLDGQSYTVIGILPAGFAYPDAATQLWTPVYHYEPAAYMEHIENHQFQAVGRLKPGVTAAQGVAELSVITRRLRDQHPENPFVSKAANMRPLLEDMVGDIERPLLVLLAATGCVLLIACLNVANLLVARAAARRKELAIRMAMGGGRLRLLRERLMESLLLSAAGGTMGLLLAYGAVRWLVSTRQGMSRVEAISIDGAVAAFTVALIALCALFAGLISSLSAKGNQLLLSLQDSARGSSTGRAHTALRRLLLAAEVGLTVVLLISAGLLLKSYQRLRSSDLGCITQNVLTMRIGLPGARYKTPGPAPVNFFETLLGRVRALPGVEAAGIVEAVPGQGYWQDEGFSVVEHPPLPQGLAQYAIFRSADPGYFAAMGIPLLRGQTFDPNRKLDRANQAIVNAAFAKQYFPNEDPLGKHLKVENEDHEIVGIVGDTRYSLAEDPKPIQYYPLYAGKENSGTLVIRSSRDVEALALPVQRILQEIDRDLPVSDVLTMDQLLGKSTQDESFNATLLATFAALSLLLAAVGLFGVLSYIVAQRTGEIGIRIALGARREQVLRQMLLDGLRPALFGLAFGLVASVGAARLIRSMLYGIQPLDPAVFAAVSAMLLLVAAMACLIPAWRASRLDPIQALRME
jgi:putative ABC transport system permease protein